MQADENCQLKPLMYFSKSLNMAQKKYSTTKKEILAIFESLREFRFIVLVYNCTVYTEHRPLSYLFKRKLPNDCDMARCSIEIDTFIVQLKYFEGKRNVVAYFLSRIEGDAWRFGQQIDVLGKCDSILSTDTETMMVMTRSTKEKINLNYIDLTDDGEMSYADENNVKNEHEQQ